MRNSELVLNINETEFVFVFTMYRKQNYTLGVNWYLRNRGFFWILRMHECFWEIASWFLISTELSWYWICSILDGNKMCDKYENWRPACTKKRYIRDNLYEQYNMPSRHCTRLFFVNNFTNLVYLPNKQSTNQPTDRLTDQFNQPPNQSTNKLTNK